MAVYGWTATSSILVVGSKRVKTDGLQKLVQKFREIESYATLPKNDIKLLPKKDAHAMKILQTTTSKVQNRYSVGLLWKEQLPELPNNRCLASSRMLSLEKKFEKSPSLKEKYVQTINEYIKDGHASILSKAEAEKESKNHKLHTSSSRDKR